MRRNVGSVLVHSVYDFVCLILFGVALNPTRDPYTTGFLSDLLSHRGAGRKCENLAMSIFYSSMSNTISLGASFRAPTSSCWLYEFRIVIVGQFHTLVFSVQCPFPIDLRSLRFDIVSFLPFLLKDGFPGRELIK